MKILGVQWVGGGVGGGLKGSGNFTFLALGSMGSRREERKGRQEGRTKRKRKETDTGLRALAEDWGVCGTGAGRSKGVGSGGMDFGGVSVGLKGLWARIWGSGVGI